MPHQSESSPIAYSRGKDKFDNCPEQQTAPDFDHYVRALFQDRGRQKGEIYFCAPMVPTEHRKPIYRGLKPWRRADAARPWRILNLDLDRIDGASTLDALKSFLRGYSAALYTTASHTEQAPRARVVIELKREVDRDESLTLGPLFEMLIEEAVGSECIKFDKAVYRTEQPIYTPLVAAQVMRFQGVPVDVDVLMEQATRRSARVDLNSDLTGHLGRTFEWPEGGVGQGSRNSTLLSYVGHLRALGTSEDRIQALARAANYLHMIPQLDHAEVDDICRRYARSEAPELTGSPGSSGSALAGCDGAVQVPLTPPPPRRYVFGKLVEAGTTAVMAGSGGSGKSIFAMQLSVALAIGKPIGDFQVGEGASLLVLGEESIAERDRRFGAICRFMSADTDLVNKRVRCYAAAGVDIRLTTVSKGNSEFTPMVEEIVRLTRGHALSAGCSVKLIVIDHLRLVLGGDPNSAEAATQLTRALNRIAQETGAVVLVIAHSPKNIRSKDGDDIDASDVSGSSAFVDNTRAGLMVYGMKKDQAKAHSVTESERLQYVRVQAVKANYADPSAGFWFKKRVLEEWGVAVLEPATLRTAVKPLKRAAADLRTRILEMLQVRPMTARQLRDRAGRDGDLQASEDKVRLEIQQMLDDGLIERRKPSDHEKRLHKLPSATREVLVFA